MQEVARQKRRARRAINRVNVYIDGKNTRLFDLEKQLPECDAKELRDNSKTAKDFIDPTEDARLEVIDDELLDGDLSWTVDSLVYVDPKLMHLPKVDIVFPDHHALTLRYHFLFNQAW